MSKSDPAADSQGEKSVDWHNTKRSRRFGLKSAIVAGCLILAGGLLAFWLICVQMPGQSFSSSKQPETRNLPSAEGTKPLSAILEYHVVKLARSIGERNLNRYPRLCEAADYLEGEFSQMGYTPRRQTFEVDGRDCFNIEVVVPGSVAPDEIVIIGAHYDSFPGTPGANDNATGTAAMLALARQFCDSTPERTLRFVAFTNEEPPWFHQRGQMGSWVYAERCSRNSENIVAVISLETMGYFTDEENSQNYPAPLNMLYPSEGNFIGFVSNVASRGLQRQVIATFRQHAQVPSEGASLPEVIPGVGWSDHWSFWQEGYAGIMVTDTAPFRYPHYHLPSDTPDKIDYLTLSKVVEGLRFVIDDLVQAD